jgi:hypothetical protein
MAISSCPMNLCTLVIVPPVDNFMFTKNSVLCGTDNITCKNKLFDVSQLCANAVKVGFLDRVTKKNYG